MKRARDPVLISAAVLVLLAVVHVLAPTTLWLGKPFAGFLLLENRVVPSAGLASWPAVDGGDIYQHELVSMDGQPVERAEDLRAYAASLPVGTPVTYRFESGPHEIERVIETRMFSGLDYTLLFGSFLFCGLGLCIVALAIRFLRRDDPGARGSALSLWLIGMWSLTATDLYGPYHLFRLHAFFECLIFAGTFHLALVFPTPRPLVERLPRLLPSIYAAAALLALWNQVGLHDPDVYVATHRYAMEAFALAALTLIGSMAVTYLRPPSFEARQRIKILALGSFAALAPQVLLSAASSLSGGRAPENLMGWSGIFFPLSIAYAVLHKDLLQVDAILRRTLNYTLLTGFVAVGYTAALVGVEPLLRLDDDGSQWLSTLLAATLLALVLLPLRDRFQGAIDRLFFRASYDFRRTLEDTSARLAAVTDLPIVTRLIERVVEEALSPEQLALEVASPNQDEIRAERGERRTLPELREPCSRVLEREDDGLSVEFIGEGRLLAVMTLGRPLSGRFYNGDDRRFLLTMANQGAVAIQNALALLRVKDLNQTLERRVEERTAALADALKELQATQHQMVHQEKMASIGQLVAGVAHEINNPLNFIQGNLFHLREYAESMQKALEGYEEAAKQAGGEVTQRIAELREELDLDYVLSDLSGLFEGCEEGVSRTTTIVKDLRTFSRNDVGPPTRIDLRGALDINLNLLRGRLAGIEVCRDYQEVPQVECLEGQMNQVFMNLIANAADALGDTGTLWVRVRREDDERVRIEVEDDGCGIPAEVRERIFEPFYTTKGVGKGTGLGLAISYGVVARHGGEIQVESEVGAGTLFRVLLPLHFREADPSKK